MELQTARLVLTNEGLGVDDEVGGGWRGWVEDKARREATSSKKEIDGVRLGGGFRWMGGLAMAEDSGVREKEGVGEQAAGIGGCPV